MGKTNILVLVFFTFINVAQSQVTSDPIIFNTTAGGLTESGGVWTATGPGGWVNVGLSSQTFTGTARIMMKYETINAIYSIMGVDSSNSLPASPYYNDINAAVAIYPNGIIKKVENNEGIPVGQLGIGDWVCLYRIGSAFKVQKSSDNRATWTDLSTLTFTSSASLYITTSVWSGGKIYYPTLEFATVDNNATPSQLSGYAFTSGAGTYTPISGISPVLTGDGTNPLHDEGYANSIPFGFTFNYLGTNYTSIGASTNGFASFGTITTPGFSNSLSTGGTGRPILAPFWEDISLQNTSNLQYSTIGAAGNRIFVLQWSNVLYDFGSGAASVSFQLRLYETTNVIEFVYNQLAGAVQDFSGGASIGITSAATGSGSFLSLNNTNALPVASSVVAVNTIVTRPASGQVYTFTPPACVAPGNLSATGITTRSATLNWTDAISTSFEYIVDNESKAPLSSGTSATFNSTTVAGLTPGSQYFLHVRKSCSGTFSGWNSLAFTTLCDTATVPYTMPISSVTAPALPLCTIASDDNNDGNTWRTYTSAKQGWTDQVIAYVYNINGTTPANDWLFTKGLTLTGGSSYRLSFKYNNDAVSLYTEKLKVAYGVNPVAGAMTNILANYTSVYSATPKNVSIDFIPPVSGTYYIGFQAYSDADKDVLILDDISVTVKPACDIPKNPVVTVQTAGTSVNVSWEEPVTGTPLGYEYVVATSVTPPASGLAITAVSAVAGSLTPNSQYYLHVRANCGAQYSAWATLPFTTVPNDEACNAIELTKGGAAVCGNTTLATTAASDLNSNCSAPNNSVWFKYTANTAGTVVLHMTIPAAPVDPLHGWVSWYTVSGNCPNITLNKEGFCAEFGKNGNNDMTDLISPVLTAGITYYIMIDGLSDDVGAFCISILPCGPAINVRVENLFSTSATIKWSGTGTYIIEYGLPGFTPGTGATAGAGGTIINATSSPQLITGLSSLTAYNVYIRQNCSESANGFSQNSTVLTFTTPGVPPVNDNCSDAVNLPIFTNICGGATPGTTLYATFSGIYPLPVCGNSAEGYDDDVWYKFTPGSGQFGVNIETISTGGYFDLVVQIYTSSNNNYDGIFSLFKCSDFDGPGNVPLFSGMQVTPGTTYFIRVFSYDKFVNSQFTICVSATLPFDNAPGAQTLVVGAGCTGAIYSNEGATQTSGEPTGSCSSLTGYSTVWFKFTAPSGGAVRISTAEGSGNTLTNSRVALFSAGDVNNYLTFNILACDEDGGAAPFGEMSVLYATGLNPGVTYYIQVDKFNNTVNAGTFCITVDILNPALLSSNADCSSSYQVPVGSVPGYKGWVSLMDDKSKLIALVKNTNPAPGSGIVSAYSIAQTLNTGPVRKAAVSEEYYLDRNYYISNSTTGNENVIVQLFLSNADITRLNTVAPGVSLTYLRITRQSGTGCHSNFDAANGASVEIPQTAAGAQNGVSWLQFSTNAFSDFYIHAVNSRLTAKVFLQGVYNAALGRHKDVTTAWANVLNTYARSQPYTNANFGYTTGPESVPNNFFTSTPATTDIVDWVLLEIKDGLGNLRSRRAAFIREDGQVVDLDGVSPVSLYSVVTGPPFYVTIRHRNHLGLSTQNTLSFTDRALGVASPTPSNFDFSTATDANIFGDAAAYKIINGTNVMITGNANSNSNVRYGGLDNDRGFILLFLGGSTPAVVNNVYSPNDVNLDGTVRYGGLNNDRAFFLTNALDGSSTLVIIEQKR